MAVKTQISIDSEGKPKSRIATTPVDRLRVAKQQLQCSNNAQTKLHTMFEEMMQELEDTKNKLETTEKELESTKSELDSMETDLIESNTELLDIREELAAATLLAQNNHNSWKTAHDDLRRIKSVLKAQKQNYKDLETKLALEKKMAKKNDTAQKKLEQLKSQWSSLSHMLGNEDHKC